MTILTVIDPDHLKFILLGIIIIGLGVILRYFKQPYIIAYILAGVLLGEHGFEIITDKALITSLGDMGLVLLLFFIGMEINLPDLVKQWKTATIGTLLQVLASVCIVAIIGYFLAWPLSRIVILGFIISLSSSAVVIKLLQESGETKTVIGQNVVSILLMQDVLIVPMLIATGYLGGLIPSPGEIFLQILGGILIIGSMVWIFKKKEIALPFEKHFKEDHELQVFMAIIVCFGFATLTAFFGLSAALGAFVGGIFIHATRSTEWFHDSLHSFRVIFVALFFVSIGMLIDLHFLFEHWETIGFFLLAVYISNHFINSAILRSFGLDWNSSLYGGALLAQIGELSYVITASAFATGIISDYTYQLTILIISLTLLLSPFWISMTKRLLKK